MEQMLKQVVRQSEELYGVFRQLESESATRGEKSVHCIMLLCYIILCYYVIVMASFASLNQSLPNIPLLVIMMLLLALSRLFGIQDCLQRNHL